MFHLRSELKIYICLTQQLLVQLHKATEVCYFIYTCDYNIHMKYSYFRVESEFQM